MTDLLPRHLLPAGNILSGIAFSLGSIMGPVLGGVFIEKYSIQAFIAVMIIIGMLAMLYIVYMKNQFASRKIESRLGHDKTTNNKRNLKYSKTKQLQTA